MSSRPYRYQRRRRRPSAGTIAGGGGNGGGGAAAARRPPPVPRQRRRPPLANTTNSGGGGGAAAAAAAATGANAATGTTGATATTAVVTAATALTNSSNGAADPNNNNSGTTNTGVVITSRPPQPWRNSDAKGLLSDDIVNGVVPNDMAPMDVYNMRPEYQVYKYDNFRANLKRLRDRNEDRKEWATRDRKAHDHDRKIRPKPALDHRGEPRWEGSEAQRQLKLDVDAGIHLTMSKRAFYYSRPVYYHNYRDLRVFRDRLYQEERSRKEIVKCRTNRKDDD